MSTTAQPALNRGGLRRVLATLCLTEITSWGVLYYAFPVLGPEIARSTGWSLPWITAGFSAGQLTAALVGIPVGRWLDRHGPRWVMTAGSVLGVPAVVLIALAPSLGWFLAAWVVAGVAMGATLYPPAFAALTRWYGPQRVKALTVLTLAAGLASTVFAPLTAALVSHVDWRRTYLVLAVILAVITIPGHLFGLRGPWPAAEGEESGSGLGDPARIARSRAFLVLTAALALTAFGAFAAVVNLVPLLIEQGVSEGTAAIALGLGGAGQVLGRLGFSTLARRTGVRSRTLVVLLLSAATTAVLGLVTSVVALIGAAIVAGMARGVFTLVQATAITDRWGAAHYGRLTGLLSAPLTITMAFAPWAGAALAGVLGGYSELFLVLGGITAVAAVLSLASTPPTSRSNS
ncbi:MFS transporter [Amycolatopsis magusensis]|uniref:MFS transporter n=1 Tax=Amycolatopsis magusensis TaxID=882444 RepID=UPI0024A91B6C|nr:MFS transporter [Amycolatopsis magusensis]MDI5978202.1 MFS transporter [Amycolatopsis magusensis]